jgi:hypothetical protein
VWLAANIIVFGSNPAILVRQHASFLFWWHLTMSIVVCALSLGAAAWLSKKDKKFQEEHSDLLDAASQSIAMTVVIGPHIILADLILMKSAHHIGNSFATMPFNNVVIMLGLYTLVLFFYLVSVINLSEYSIKKTLTPSIGKFRG